MPKFIVYLDTIFYIVAIIPFIINISIRYREQNVLGLYERKTVLHCDIISLIIYVAILVLRANAAEKITLKFFLQFPTILIVFWMVMAIRSAILYGWEKRDRKSSIY